MGFAYFPKFFIAAAIVLSAVVGVVFPVGASAASEWGARKQILSTCTQAHGNRFEVTVTYQKHVSKNRYRLLEIYAMNSNATPVRYDIRVSGVYYKNGKWINGEVNHRTGATQAGDYDYSFKPYSKSLKNFTITATGGDAGYDPRYTCPVDPIKRPNS